MARVKYLFLPVSAILLFCFGNSYKDEPPCLGPVDMAYSEGQGKIYIAEYHGKQIDVFDLRKNALVGSFPLKDHPNRVYITRDQKLLLVSEGMEKGRLLAYDLDKERKMKEVTVGHSPTAIAESDDHFIICNRFPGEITFLDKDKFRIEKRVNVGREPMALVTVTGMQKLFIAHHLPEMASTEDHVAAKISVIDLSSLDVIHTFLLPNGSSSVKDITLHPGGRLLFVTHILARYQLPSTQLERGWMNTNAMTVIDAERMECRHTLLLDDIDHGAANPWDLDFSEDGKKIYISHAGTHELSIINWEKMAEALKEDETNGAAYATSEDLGFIYPYRRRVALNGNGPRAISSNGAYLYVANHFSDNLSIIDLDKLSEQSIRLGEFRLPDERLGEMYFHDASLCFQNWQSCVSCHPDARVDGLNWDLLNDGIGNPKNAKSLLLSHETPPAMALGVRSHAELAVRAGFKHIQFAEVPEEYSARVDFYLKGILPVPSPYRISGKEREKGKALFMSLNCQECHPAPLYTNLKSYPLGEDPDLNWDTPTLVELWRTGPYWHDGRYASLSGLFRDGMHGLETALSEFDLKVLEAYLLSL